MAWAEKLRSGRYRGMYRDAVGDQRNATPGITYTRAAEAERIAGAKELEQRQPGAIQPGAGKLTWGTWADDWWVRRNVADSTSKRDESRRHAHLDPKWAAWPLEDITRAEVETWVIKMRRDPKLSPSTVQRIYHLFSASMKAAALDRRILASPCVSITLDESPLPDEVYLTKAEVERIAFWLRRPYRILVLVGAYTGLRWGELAALHRQRIDFDARSVDVSLAHDTKNRTYKAPKSHERRHVPLPGWLADVLEQWCEELGPAKRCGLEHPAKLRSRCTSGLLVPGAGGVPVDYDSFRRNHWARAVGEWEWTNGVDSFSSEAKAAAELGSREGLRRQWREGAAEVDGPVTIHGLRHSYASWTLQSGVVGIEQLSKLMGHKSVLTTQRYAHLAQTQWDAVRSALERPDGVDRGVPRGADRPTDPHGPPHKIAAVADEESPEEAAEQGG